MRYTLLACLIIAAVPLTSTFAQTVAKDENYYQQKAEQASKSTEMRKAYYDSYKAKGYDVSSLTSDLLDGSKTEEWKFWEALKKIQNTHEMKDRKAYVEKYRSKGVDVSGFTDEVMNDSGKFWELVKKLQPQYEAASKEATSKDAEAKKQAPVNTEKKPQPTQEKKPQEVAPQKKPQTNPIVENAKKLFIAKLDKIPEDEREATYARLETNILKQLEVAKKRNAKTTIMKLEALLTILQERMEGDVDDESLVNSLF